ncbi:UPF0280 family protein (plasmid) [Sulfitobacter sp. S190]|nr:UPF0280 family protein [Sulfitobacter sp. S190]
MGPTSVILSCGTRLHLQHGPIDLIIGAEGDRHAAFDAARARFASVLDELVDELPALRRPMTPETPRFNGSIAQLMFDAVLPHAGSLFVTPMAAVAGAVADTVLAAMAAATGNLSRAYVNNGGDIAVHLEPGASFQIAMAGADNSGLGQLRLSHGDGARGIATSGRLGRSLSLGIADSVTVTARSAAAADVAATLIANAVDLPDHPGIGRALAEDIDPDTDLTGHFVTTACPRLPPSDVNTALARGLETARRMQNNGLIDAAALFLQGQCMTVALPETPEFERTPLYA